MNKPTLERRNLKFQSFDEVVADAESLLQQGYQTQGKWNLSQCCGHLADWMRYPMDGFPQPPIFLRPIFWLFKITLAKRFARNILANGFQPGTPTAPQSVPAADARNDADSVDFLKTTIDRLQNHSGPFHPSPLFGETDRATLTKINLMHAELHLSFFHPKNA